MKSIGIDIGTSSIKIVEIQTTTKGYQVHQYFEHRFSPSSKGDHELEIIEYLRDFVSRNDPAQTHYIMSLRQDRVAIRTKTFPFSDRIKIHKSLPFELEEDIPFSVENAIFDAKIIRTMGPTSEVLACASPKVHIQNALQLAQDSGFELTLLSVEGIALGNIVERWTEPPPSFPAPSLQLEEAVKPLRHVNIQLQMGHTHTLVSAYEGNVLVGTRSILWGGQNIAEAIARKYEIPPHEAIKELETKSFILTNKQGATFDQVTFSETIAKSVRELVRDLQLSLLEFKAEFNAQVISVGVSGGASQIQNLGPFLTQLLEVPVNRVATLQSFPQVLFDKTPQIEAKMGVALGLAVEGLKRPRNPAINFLRGPFAKQNFALQALWEKWSTTLKVAAAAVVVLFVYTMIRDNLAMGLAERAQEVLKSQAKSVAKLSTKNATEAGIKKYIRENKKHAADLRQLSHIAGMNSALDILKKINDAAPPKNGLTVDVRKLSIEQSDVLIEGYAGSVKELNSLQQSLINVSLNGKISPRPSSLSPIANKTAFALSFQVDRGVQKVTK